MDRYAPPTPLPLPPCLPALNIYRDPGDVDVVEPVSTRQQQE